MCTHKWQWDIRGRIHGGPEAHQVNVDGMQIEAATMRRAKASPAKAGGRARARKGASSCMIIRQMADRYAGGGTTLASDVASTAAGCTYVRLALVPIQSMHVTAAANRRTRQEEPRKGAASQPDGTRRWAKPRAHRSKEAQRGAHVREGR